MPKRTCYSEEVEELISNLINELLSNAPGKKEVSILLWNNKKIWGEGEKLRIKINYPWSLKESLRKLPDLSLAEAYTYNLIDLDGDIFLVFPIVQWITEEKNWGIKEKVSLWKKLRKLPGFAEIQKCEATVEGELHSIERDKKAIEYHYDISNDFYKLFLDRHMVYSCAYFQSYKDSLDKAQENKIDYICRKLMLKKGEKLLDIGCGWGALIIHAVKKYGVKATGITLSKNQYNFVKEKIKEENLEDKCTVLLADYRELNEWNSYDKVVSVGMFEHVGLKNAGLYFEQIHRLLREKGVFLNHAISCNYHEYGKPASQFIRKYVFPDGELLPIHLTIEKAEEAGFEVRDVESLREHYTMTLMHWVRNLEKNREKAVEIAGEEKFRIWRLYMAASAYQFLTNRTGLYQTLLVKTAKDGSSGFPLTREHLYRNSLHK